MSDTTIIAFKAPHEFKEQLEEVCRSRGFGSVSECLRYLAEQFITGHELDEKLAKDIARKHKQYRYVEILKKAYDAYIKEKADEAILIDAAKKVLDTTSRIEQLLLEIEKIRSVASEASSTDEVISNVANMLGQLIDKLSMMQRELRDIHKELIAIKFAYEKSRRSSRRRKRETVVGEVRFGETER